MLAGQPLTRPASANVPRAPGLAGSTRDAQDGRVAITEIFAGSLGCPIGGRIVLLCTKRRVSLATPLSCVLIKPRRERVLKPGEAQPWLPVWPSHSAVSQSG